MWTNPEFGRVHRSIVDKTRDRHVSKLIVGDLAGGDAEDTQHLRASLDHHGRTAQVVFYGGRVAMFLEILFPDNIMDEADRPGPIVLRLRR